MPKAEEIKTWLEGLGFEIIKIGSVKIALPRVEYPAVMYRHRDRPSERRIYAAGQRPKHTRQNKTCYSFNGGEWYVAYYMDANRIKPEFAEFHPFGANFGLFPWEVPSGEKIDCWERRPYDRVAMSFQETKG